MRRSVMINRSLYETRVGVVEDGSLVELHVERAGERGLAGNVYLGAVVRVLPGMQAAFVEFGEVKAGFLYVDEAWVERKSAHDKAPPIDQILKAGQQILVQVQREPVGSKGARLTRQISLPGHHVVLTRESGHIGVSLRIESEEERLRLKTVLEGCCPKDQGIIARTAAEGATQEELEAEVLRLSLLYQNILKRSKTASARTLIQSDLDVVLRVVRDAVNENTEKVLVDDIQDEACVRQFLGSIMPEKQGLVEHYQGERPIFENFGLEDAVTRSRQRQVWLTSGGSIVIDEAEALTAVDINSGRYVGKTNLEDTITRINLEATKEVAYQLRLRNIAGIIVIDFIDMENHENRQAVLDSLEAALALDRVKTSVVRMSELGLVQLTRKRVRPSLAQLFSQDCPYCKGRGRVQSYLALSHDILRRIESRLSRYATSHILVNMAPEIADFLYEEKGEDVELLEKKYSVQIIPVARQGYHIERFEVVGEHAAAES